MLLFPHPVLYQFPRDSHFKLLVISVVLIFTFVTKNDSSVPLLLSLSNLENIYGLPAIKGEELTHIIPSLLAPPFDNYV